MSRIGMRQERLDRLATLLVGRNHLRLSDVAADLGVSEMTIRRDVVESAGRFACLGGHIVGSQPDAAGGYILEKQTDRHAEAKRAACAKAADLVQEDDTIFIDCGTTMPHLASMIPKSLRLTAVCYSLNVAEILSRREATRLILLGGVFHPGAASFSGEPALQELQRLNINKAFISAGGVHDQRGATCFHFHEVPIKRAAIERAVESYLVVDSSKFGLVRAAHFADMSDFTAVLSDKS